MRIVVFEGDIKNAIVGFRKALVKKLADSGNEVIIVGFNAYNDEFDFLDKKDVPYQTLELGQLSSNPILFAKPLIRLFSFLIKCRPDLCLTFNIRPVLLFGMVNVFLRIPSIATITGTSTLVKGDSLSLIIKILSLVFFKNYKVLFFQNGHDANLFSKICLNQVKTVLVPGSGVDTNVFFNNHESKQEIQIPVSDFLLVSRIIRQKGILEYIEAAYILKQKYPHLIFGLLGPFYQNSKDTNAISPELIEKAQNDNVIKYYGFSNDVKPYIQFSKCVILPSYGEGMSNTLLEAASMERPILASNVPGCKEIVDNGVTGILFESQSVKGLVDAIEQFLRLSEDERIKMGLLGREKMIEQFDKAIVVGAYMNEIGLYRI